MTVQLWDDQTLVVQLADDPDLSDDMAEVRTRLGSGSYHVVLDLAGLALLTSSGIAKLLRLRKQMLERGWRLLLCAPQDRVWGVFLATGLDAIFEFTDSVAEALARLQGGRT